MNQATRYRRISPNEWLYLSSIGHFGPFAIQFLIEADSLPPLDTIRAAVAKAAACNPGARLARKGAWWIDLATPPVVRHLARTERFALSHLAICAALPSEGAIPLEIVCWEGAGILFRCAHALMDAGGLLFFAEEVFRALRGEALLGSTSAVSDRDYVLGLQHPKSRRTLRPASASPLGTATPGHSGFVWERRMIPGKFTATAARLTSAIAHLSPPAKQSGSRVFMFPVDLRNVDPALRTTGNLSNPIFLDVPDAAEWNDAYARTLAAFAAQEERATSRLDALAPLVPLALLGRFNHWEHEREVRSNRHLFSALVSHIGSISLASFSCPAFAPHAASFLPFDAPGSALTLITLQHDHGLEISASCPAATGHDGKLAHALELICALLLPEPLHADAVMPALIVVNSAVRPASGPQVVLPAGLTVWSLFVEQAKANPLGIALVDGDRAFRYSDVLRRARAGAKRLRDADIAPGDKVAILSTRSSDTIIAMLAIFLAGAAFVPIDPDWPAERIGFVLGDCAPHCVAADDELAALATGHLVVRLTSLCEDDSDPSENVMHDFEIPQGGLAYVLYTSGSTGRPKGVMVGHESLLNYVLWSNDAYLGDLDTPCVFPFFTSLAFDLTLTSLFLPLTTGGAIHVFRQTDPLSAVSAILLDSAINAVKLTPSHLRLFLAAGMTNSGIGKLIVGGEALPVSLARDICAQDSKTIDIYNEYGPTEATVGCIVHHFDPERDRDTFVPIGRPIANTEVLLVDERGNPVPDGTTGEIVLAGRCLAQGYLALAEEDARFVAHPLEVGSRAYRTGDSGSRRPDGTFDYHGRIDLQVKIRGYRVELGEVEAAIERTGLCRAFAVLAEDSGGGARLVACVVWRPDAGGKSGEQENQLRVGLAATLPAYMIPARIVVLDGLPLTINGKVDKRALSEAANDNAQTRLRPAVVSTSQDIESQLMEILAQVAGAGLAGAARDASLLELGLDSLQMMLLLTLAAKRFLPALSRHAFLSGLTDFLRAPTIVNLAAYLRQAG